MISPMKEKDPATAIPHLFRCPISLDLLKDPVTVSTGQTYERSSIQQWLDSGHHTCPVTMQPLPDPALVPNLTLRHLIRRWLRDGAGEKFGVLPLLLDLAFSGDGDKSGFVGDVVSLGSSTKTDLCRLLSKALSPEGELCSDDEGKSMVVNGLISYLAAGEKGGLTAAAREILRQVLIPFSSESESLSVLIGDERLVSLFRRGSSSTKANLCRLISSAFSASSSPAINSLSGELLHEVAIFIAPGSEFSAAGVELLWTLSGHEANIAILAGEEAIVNGLISYLSAGDATEPATEPATEILLRLLAVDGAREALMRNPKGVSALVKRVFVVSGDQRGNESAMAALTWLCRGSPAAKEAAIDAGVLTQLLFLLQSQCNGRTKTKARTLLKLLR